jgi:hypothetical protein
MLNFDSFTAVMLEKAGISLGQVDQVEINEAFAAQTLACQKECWLAIHHNLQRSCHEWSGEGGGSLDQAFLQHWYLLYTKNVFNEILSLATLNIQVHW